MHRGVAILIASYLLSAVISTGCGPKCPEVKTAMSDKELKDDDASRVNKMVDRRKKLMEKAESQQLATFDLERLQFSVTAYEMAIQLQLRIIELAAGGESYAQNLAEINDTRCMMDDILQAKLLKPDDYTLNDTTGKKIQEKYNLFKSLFGKEGEIPVYELESYYDNGLGKADAEPKKTLITEEPLEEKPAEEAADKKDKKGKKAKKGKKSKKAAKAKK